MLVLAEVVLIVLSIILQLSLTRFLPEPLRNFEEQTREAEFTAAELLVLVLGLAALVMHVIAWILVWRRSAVARLVYTASWAALLLLTPFVGPVVQTGVARAVDDVASAVGGAILALLYFAETPT